MDTLGPLARTVEDVGIAFNCLAGIPSGRKPEQEKAPRLARLDHLWREDLSPSADIAALFDTTIHDLELAGAKISHQQTSSLKSFNSVGWLTLFAEAFQVHKDVLSRHPDRFGSTLREMLISGAHVSSEEYIKAQHLRMELTNSIDEILRGVDGIVLPVSAALPCELEDKNAMANLAGASVRMICNVTGHPALALPNGLSSNGLPIGIQIIGRKHDEEHLIEIGSWVQNNLKTWLPNSCPDVFKTAQLRSGSHQAHRPRKNTHNGLNNQMVS